MRLLPLTAAAALLAASATGALGAPRCAPLPSDPRGDHGLPSPLPAGTPDSWDILGMGAAVSPTTMTIVWRVADLEPAPVGSSYQFRFTGGGWAHRIHAYVDDAGGGFYLSSSSQTEPEQIYTRVSGSYDAARNEIRVNVPATAFGLVRFGPAQVWGQLAGTAAGPVTSDFVSPADEVAFGGRRLALGGFC